MLGQVRVVDINDLGTDLSFRISPDVEGKVAICESYFNYITAKTTREEITIFPGYPVNSSGANERGGIYVNIDDDPAFELIYPVGAALHAFKIDGTNATGWPRTLDYPTDGAAAFGDIDGDGAGEIVVTTHQVATFAFGTVYAFEIDGSNVSGFPVTTEGGGIRTPVLADLNGDDALEIIITVRNWPDGLVYVYRGDGTIYNGWPVRMDYVPASAVAVGDIDGDEIPEIIAESYYGLHAFTPDGLLIEGFPYYPAMNRVFSYSSPVLADITGNGKREIIFGDHSLEDGSGAIHIIDHEGNSLEGWPQITGSWIYGPPSVGDIDGDGLLDIAVGDQALSAVPVNKIYAWTGITAETLQGFPILEVFGVNSQIILADFDGDEMIELVFDDNTEEGKYPGYNHDGTIMEGWPLQLNGSTFFVNPLVVDINQDGIMDMSGGGAVDGSGSTNIYLWNLNVEMDNRLAILPILQYNTRHNGVYGDTLMVGIKEVETMIYDDWHLYPNPVTDYLTLTTKNRPLGDGISISLYNASGTLLLNHISNKGESDIKLSLESYPPGVYLLYLFNANKLKKVFKFIRL